LQHLPQGDQAMTGRATIDIIAELRDALGAGIYRPLTNEAADRLAELDAIVQAVIAHGSEHSPVNDDIRSFCNYLINGRTP